MKNQLKKISLLLLVAGAASAHADNWDNGPGRGNLPGYVGTPDRGDRDGHGDFDHGPGRGGPDFDRGPGRGGPDFGRGPGRDGPDFGRGPGRGPGYGGGMQTKPVTCSSIDKQPASCGAQMRIVSVRLVRQHSDADCIPNRTWGYDSNSIWVSRGCRATFEVQGYRGW